jgi:hypothetical protein
VRVDQVVRVFEKVSILLCSRSRIDSSARFRSVMSRAMPWIAARHPVFEDRTAVHFERDPRSVSSNAIDLVRGLFFAACELSSELALHEIECSGAMTSR